MRNLDSLPFDVLFETARYLSLDDVVALGCTSRRLRAVVRGEEALCRMVVQPSQITDTCPKNNAPFAREALQVSQAEQNATLQPGKRPRQQQSPSLLRESSPTFCGALQKIHARRAAFAAASPRSACVVDYASDFLYGEGVLCYVYSQPSSSGGGRNAIKIRVLDLEDGGRELALLDVSSIAQSVVERAGVKECANDEDSERARKRRRREERDGSPCWEAQEHAEMQCGEMAYLAAAMLGFDAPLWEDPDAMSPGRSRSASPCSLASPQSATKRWSLASPPSSSTSAAHPLPRVTLVHQSASVLSLYLNFSSSRSAPSAPTFLKLHPHYLVAIRLAKSACSSASASVLRVFRLPNRVGGYGSDDDFGIDSTPSTNSEGEGDGAGRGLKLFVRNTDACYYFGTHTGCGTRGQRVWVVHGVSLIEGAPLKLTDDDDDDESCRSKRKSSDGGKGDMAKLTLPQMVSKALGVDTWFFIHDGYCYGLTTSGSAVSQFAPANTYAAPRDLLHDPHVSTYSSIRFPLASPTTGAVETGSPVFRRHHGIEGPINDSWTTLGAVLDERSGEAQVIEERKEWGQERAMQEAGRSGGAERSWYFSTLGFGENDSSSERGVENNNQEEEVTDSSGGSRNDSGFGSANGSLRVSGSRSSQPQALFLGTPSLYDGSPLDAFLPDFNVASSDATRSRPWIRNVHRVHRENSHGANAVSNDSDRRADALHSFTLSRTKHRTYNFSARAFLDLVEDEQCCPGASCLRVRVGVRRERTKQVHENVSGNEAYVHERVRMWPPASPSSTCLDRAGCHCSRKPHAIMNAPLQGCQASTSFGSAQAVDVVAVTDERCAVFLRRPKYGRGRGRTGPLVMISFDEGISAAGLDGLRWKRERRCSCR